MPSYLASIEGGFLSSRRLISGAQSLYLQYTAHFIFIVLARYDRWQGQEEALRNETVIQPIDCIFDALLLLLALLHWQKPALFDNDAAAEPLVSDLLETVLLESCYRSQYVPEVLLQVAIVLI